MKLESYRCLWGVLRETDGQAACSPHTGCEDAFPAIKALGYDGVEAALKLALDVGRERFKGLLEEHGLRVNFVIFTDGPVCPGAPGPMGGPYEGFTPPNEPGETDKALLVKTHLQVFKEQVLAAKYFGPTLVNSHSLKDSFTVPMAEEFFAQAMAWVAEQGFGFEVLHETHRKRFLHSPWVARDFLPKFPGLKLVADLSHWTTVAETNTEDPDLTQVIEDIAPQVYHVHCRVGYDHGPQVPDPRAPEWKPYMEGHERWWDAIWRAQAARGQEVTTMIAEHGPPNYQQTLPYSRVPVAMIWDVNHWISLRRQRRFAELFGEERTSKLVPSGTQDHLPETNPGSSVLEGKRRQGFRLSDEALPPTSGHVAKVRKV